jgi:cohesin complex subunit SA-1/2
MKEMLLMSPVQLFKEETYVSICDFLILFYSQLACSPHLLPFVYVPDRALQHLLNDFFQSYLFIDKEKGTFIISNSPIQ